MAERRRLGDIVSEIPGQISGLIKAEIGSLKREVTGKVKGLGIGAGLLAAAAVLALFMLGWLITGGFFAWTLLFPEWAAALLTAASLLVLILLVAIPGILMLNKNKDFGQMRAVESIKDDVNMVQGLGHAGDGSSATADLRSPEDRKDS